LYKVSRLFSSIVTKSRFNRRILVSSANKASDLVSSGINSGVSFALELDCEVVIKATKYDGVYNKDPAKFDDAIKLGSVSFQEAVEDNAIKVMDKAAIGLAMEQQKPIIVFDVMKPDNLLKIVKGDQVGTIIS
jgi:uridylate kinase